MKLRSPRLIRLVAFVLARTVQAWNLTIRNLKHYVDGTVHPTDPAGRRCIYAIWHDSIFSLLYIRTKIDILISHHADGELITQTCKKLGFGVVRGSSSRGGTAALMKMVEQARDRHLLVTPDGPRGPRHVIRPGLAYLASITGLPIVLIAVGYSRAWYLKTWDRMAIPRPWSTTYGVLSEPIYVAPEIRPEDLGEICGRIERRFIQLTATAEQWAATGVRPERADLTPAEPSALPQCV